MSDGNYKMSKENLRLTIEELANQLDIVKGLVETIFKELGGKNNINGRLVSLFAMLSSLGTAEMFYTDFHTAFYKMLNEDLGGIKT